MYVYDIPYGDRLKFCDILDSGEQMWKQLAGEIGLSSLDVSVLEIEYHRINGSPTDRLLNKWGQRNATVDMLASKLISVKALRAFEAIKHLVSSHVLESLGEGPNVDPPTNQYSFRRSENGRNVVSDKDLPLPSLSSNESSTDEYKKKKAEIVDDDKEVESINSYPELLMKTLPCHPFANIAAATKGLNVCNIIGKGRFGAVYKGQLNQATVAVKVLNQGETKTCSQSFYDEVYALRKAQHQNVILLMGISIDGPSFCFVYQYMDNGSLRDRLQCKVGGDLDTIILLDNYSILRDVSQGLLHLHSMMPKPMVHKNIKSSNVLLGVNFIAKLGDFGFACEPSGIGTINFTQVTRRDQLGGLDDLRAYMPDDFFRSSLHSCKTDVYSFGVVVFETCTGRDAIAWLKSEKTALSENIHELFTKHEQNPKQLFQLLKDKLARDWTDKPWMTLMVLGKWCTSVKKNDRPSALDISKALEKCYQDVINDVSSLSKDKLTIGGGINDDSDDSFINNMDTKNTKQVLSKVQTTCIRKSSKVEDANIYSSSRNQPNQFSKENFAQNKFKAINCRKDYINKMQVENPFPEFAFDPVNLSENDTHKDKSYEKFDFKSSSTSINLTKSPPSRESNSKQDDNKLNISFSSKECSSSEISSSGPFPLASGSSPSDMESLIKQLNLQDLERFAKLEKLKKDFPEEF